MRFPLLFSLSALCLMLSGCASPFTEYYHPYDATADQTAQASIVNPRLVQLTESTTLTVATNNAISEGYKPMGYSSFNGCGNWGDTAVNAQAKRLGATLTVWKKTPAAKKRRFNYNAVFFNGGPSR